MCSEAETSHAYVDERRTSHAYGDGESGDTTHDTATRNATGDGSESAQDWHRVRRTQKTDARGRDLAEGLEISSKIADLWVQTD